MGINENYKKVIEPIFMVALISILIFLSNVSLLILATGPILLSIYIFKYGYKGFLLTFVGTFILGLLYMDIRDLIVLVGLIFLISLCFYLPIRYQKNDKRQILTVFILLTLILTGSFSYSLVKEGLSLDYLANEMREIIEGSLEYDMPLEYIKLSIGLYPSFFAFFSFIYSLIGIKLIRNYVSIKLALVDDLKNANELRLEYKDMLGFVAFVGISYMVAFIFKLDMNYIYLNLFGIFLVVMAFNGLSTYDYMISKSSIPVSRGFQWFFIIILLEFLLIFFVILGFIDIILDIRKKRSLNE
ncbi:MULTISPECIES: hypothetical protein [Anaerococcus]|uniref:hypothetical protein n=1 Tax=Anaerococcus TaxID=165779 RepID=UPI0027BB21BC|nr:MULTISPECIES: hypothetical protein [Anaerococcus]MDU2558133.1 hypothetical protein [Anaerococcus prevotii]MDU3136549.1 hypothetical protein [Anaerococcus prevotii]